MEFKTSKEIEYDTKNAMRILDTLNESVRGMTIHDIAKKLNLNRHTVTKLLERMLIEKKVNYDEKGPAKIYYSVGPSKFVGKIDQGYQDTLWINIFRPKYPGEEEFVRINQTKHDHLIRASSKFKSVGAVAIKRNSLINLIRILRDVARKEFGLNV
ncbi:MAG: helix-turn-helix domain-containing protein [Candidatus Aenigmatarchaeota archaeon]|nr:helix-turn-helix domain-containing protein [Candidatus Aenigmarchaeota archaeon]